MHDGRLGAPASLLARVTSYSNYIVWLLSHIVIYFWMAVVMMIFDTLFWNYVSLHDAQN